MLGRAARLTTALVALTVVATACGTRVDPASYQEALGREGGSAPAAGVLPQGPIDATENDRTALGGGGPRAGPAVPGATRPGTADGDWEATSEGPARGAERSADSAAGRGETLPEVSRAVVGEVITVGMHVPETGAAPLPSDWEDALRAIEDHINRERPIHGRQLRLVVVNDGYDPATGRAACRRLLSDEPLLVIGHTMPAAQDACAALFNDHGVPYLMRGTTPDVLKGRPLAFFGTTPDDVQGRLLADYILRELDAANRPVGVLFQDDQLAARDTFVARIRERGGSVAVVDQGAPRQADYGATIQKLRAAGVELVFLSTPPVDAIKIAVQALGEGYRPIWLGGGTYWNYNLTLEAAGSAMDGAVSLSPWPTIDSPAANEFKAVYRAYRPDREPADLGLIMWGWANLLYELLEASGPDLSRHAVLETLQDFEFRRPYWNPVSYARFGRAGAAEVAVFRADGQARRWRQVSDFAGGF